MEKRRIGNTQVSALGLGCMGFSHAYGAPMEENEAIKRIRNAYDLGYTYFDTAEVYKGEYEDGCISYNEEIVAKALKDVRNNVFISTKFGVHINEDRSLKTDSSKKKIIESLNSSLKRLNTDHIDLYYQHRTDPKVEPEEVASLMADLIKEGKILSWGISEVSEEYLRRADKVCHVSAIQNRYSMMARDCEKLFPTLEELDIALVAFSPLANGFLTEATKGSFKNGDSLDYRNFLPQFSEEGYERGKELLDLVRKISLEKNITIAQLSLAWMLSKKTYIIPIPGTRKVERMQENAKAAEVRLNDDEIKMLDDALSKMSLLVFSGSKTN